MTVNRIGRSGKGRRTQRVFIGARAAIGNAATIPAKHFDIGQKMMAKGDRLGGLKVGKARHDGFGMGAGLFDQCFLKALEARFKIGQCHVAHPEFEIGRDLVIAGARGMQATGGRPDQITQAAFDIHVDVFKGGREGKLAALDFLKDLV